MAESTDALSLLRAHVEFLREHNNVRTIRLSRQGQAGLARLVAEGKEKRVDSRPPGRQNMSSAPAVPAPVRPRTPPPIVEKAVPARPVVLPLVSVPLTLEGSTKVEQLLHLSERAGVCMKCTHLAARRRHVVFGIGNPDAEVMFVGEAPGAEEDEQGEPFVGKAGQLLTKMIIAMGLTREQVYIANIVKCRPDMPPGAPGNRKPTRQEMETCIPYLHAQIDVIKPKALVALGATSLEGLLGPIGSISSLRGKFQEYRGIPVMPTYHPSYLLRNASVTEKRKVWEDLLQVMEKVQMPISEKQRNFFLKG